ncbi:hypothetical protein MFU01_66940 [Myxococcus fulvus]|uniref:Uncharacterized protein n=1 Tax=Myxococcus fulvus TaxID=33 RepID=A0A511TC00_MYXFU|nr:hypothetical protein MFU01_66940 [Myxococcus fulvus]
MSEAGMVSRVRFAGGCSVTGGFFCAGRFGLAEALTGAGDSADASQAHRSMTRAEP